MHGISAFLEVGHAFCVGLALVMGMLVDAVETSFKHMDEWLTAEDSGAIELARSYAREIEAGIERGGQDATKALYLGPHLLKTLAELGGTPAGRKVLNPSSATKSVLAQMRADRDN